MQQLVETATNLIPPGGFVSPEEIAAYSTYRFDNHRSVGFIDKISPTGYCMTVRCLAATLHLSLPPAARSLTRSPPSLASPASLSAPQPCGVCGR